MAGVKTCTKCAQSLPLDSFYHRAKRGKSIPLSRCKPCTREVERERYHANPDRQRNRAREYSKNLSPEALAARRSRHLKRRYGISADERDAMLAAQGGVCAICSTPEPSGWGWAVDHDHACCPGVRTCGKCVRGILCSSCNLALGHMEDDPDRLLQAATYLVKCQDNLKEKAR